MAFMDYVPLVSEGISLAMRVMVKINKKKADDGKIDEQEALEIAAELAPELMKLISPFVR